MKIRFCLGAAVFLAVMANAVPVSAGFTVKDTRNVVSVDPSRQSGLENVFVVENTGGARLVYTASTAAAASSARWMCFDMRGGGFAQAVTGSTVNGNDTSIPLSGSDSGYIVEVEGRQYACWVTDYALHQPTVTGIELSPEQECDRTTLIPQGIFDRMTYYGVNGAPTEIDRGIKLTYYDLKSNLKDALAWEQTVTEREFAYVAGPVSVTAPLCNTAFILTGDRFTRAWGYPVSVETPVYQATRVEALTSAEQSMRDNDNEQKEGDGDTLGGSAPVEITFTAQPSDAAVFMEWQFSDTPSFDNILYRFNQEILEYTFNETGTTYVRFVCADASGKCEYQSDTYTVTVGQSVLLCPNAFSPANQDGVNDLWKVSYSGIIRYECHIFNRWGKELFSSRNPAEGWDGRAGGKFVPAGVYFYVIDALGADGKHYKLSGDINIVGSRLNPMSSGEAGE